MRCYSSPYDFKRLFTISEFYDWDRAAFYRALQGVREAGMDLTGWREQAISQDVLARRHGLTERQNLALGHVLEHGWLVIWDFERLCPGVHRRSLQRDLKVLQNRNLLVARGDMNRLESLVKKELAWTCDRLATGLATGLPKSPLR